MNAEILLEPFFVRIYTGIETATVGNEVMQSIWLEKVQKKPVELEPAQLEDEEQDAMEHGERSGETKGRTERML